MNATVSACRNANGPPPFGPVPAGFEVLRLAAAGPVCEVWKVCEARTGTPFAWKRLKPQPTADPRAVERIRNEARVLERSRGRSVVALERDMTDDNPPSMLLEWLEGHPLKDRLVRGEPLLGRTAFWIGRQIAEGMASLAAAGYAHGGLRPPHVFVDFRGVVRLLDPGSAMRLDGNAAPAGSDLAFGTAEYLPPECQTGAPFDPLAADVYRLGVMLFEMLSGRPPFTGDNPQDVLRLHRQAKPRVGCEGLPVPSAGVELMESMLRKQPLRRPRDPVALVRRLLDLELQTMVLGMRVER